MCLWLCYSSESCVDRGGRRYTHSATDRTFQLDRAPREIFGLIVSGLFEKAISQRRLIGRKRARLIVLSLHPVQAKCFVLLSDQNSALYSRLTPRVKYIYRSIRKAQDHSALYHGHSSLLVAMSTCFSCFWSLLLAFFKFLFFAFYNVLNAAATLFLLLSKER